MNKVDEQMAYWITFIKNRMRDMKLDADDVFMNGNCGNLYFIFKRIFKEHKPVPHRISYENEPMHIVTEIDGKLYDISGATDLEKYCRQLEQRNGTEFDLSKFSERTVDDQKARKQCDKYRYDDDYEQSLIQNEMDKLDALIDAQLKQLGQQGENSIVK